MTFINTLLSLALKQIVTLVFILVLIKAFQEHILYMLLMALRMPIINTYGIICILFYLHYTTVIKPVVSVIFCLHKGS